MKARGFTLLEISIVLILVGILWSFAMPTYGDSDDCLDKPKWKQQAFRTAAIADLAEIWLRADSFELNHRRYPTSLAEIDMHNKRDPWGMLYVYLDFAGLDGNGQKRKYKNDNPVNTWFDAYSLGRDGLTATPFTASPGEDDIVLAHDGHFIDVACKFGSQ